MNTYFGDKVAAMVVMDAVEGNSTKARYDPEPS